MFVQHDPLSSFDSSQFVKKQVQKGKTSKTWEATEAFTDPSDLHHSEPFIQYNLIDTSCVIHAPFSLLIDRWMIAHAIFNKNLISSSDFYRNIVLILFSF